jgi:FlaA1/EpsC-like NDP-sugar epimerase
MDLLTIRARFAPRWLILCFDIAIILCALVLAYALRFDFKVPSNEWELLKKSAILFFLVRITALVLWRTYAGVIRYTSTQDASRILRMNLAATIALFMLGLLRNLLVDSTYFLPTSILILEFFISTFMMVAYRLVIKLVFAEQNFPKKNRKEKVYIYGAGEAGLIMKRSLDQDMRTGMEVIAFIDDDRKKAGKNLEGVPIKHTSDLNRHIESDKPAQVIMSIMVPDPKKRQAVIDTCVEAGIPMLDVPPVKQWIKGELSFKQLKPIPVEDILDRDVITLNKSAIAKSIEGKRIMITGAAGSIGSEICRQLIHYSPESLLLVDQAESPLHALSLELAEAEAGIKIDLILGDITDASHMRSLIEKNRPQVLYHAAAYKHVPLVEANAVEGIKTNVLGTRSLTDLALEFKVERFVLVSTDKAVNPTNVMGATKRAAEIYVQSRPAGNTIFITTRFGNVLGSNGSVIPLFKEQIEKGGPITVTHPDIERYFMTIPEASQLVLEAAAMGEGNNIFVFDRGKPVKILDLAKKLIRLSGLELDKDIEIAFSGLRPGEKIKEEVLADLEDTLPTHNKRVLIAKTRENTKEEVNSFIMRIENSAGDDFDQIKILKEMIPEFKSNNSKYDSLDKV